MARKRKLPPQGGEDRYYAKRQAGIDETRSDGSLTSAATDQDATAAEAWAAHMSGAQFNSQVYSRRGDHEPNFTLTLVGEELADLFPGVVIPPAGLTVKVQVQWAGRWPSGTPRRQGHCNLIVNPYEPKRWGDLYLLVVGGEKEGFSWGGWITHAEFLRQKRDEDFGYGLKWAITKAELRPVSTLSVLVPTWPAPAALQTAAPPAAPPADPGPQQLSLFG